MKFPHLKKMGEQGFDHVLVGIAFAVLIAIGGSWYLIKAHAAQWAGALSVGPQGSNYCMDAPTVKTGAYVYLNKCNSKLSQKWQLANAGTVKFGGKTLTAYTIQNYTAGTQECVDDWNGSVSQGRANLLRLYTCNSVDMAQRFFWTGDNHQLRNIGALNRNVSLCIDDLGNSKAANTNLDLYTCKANTSGSQDKNQDWWEIVNNATNPTPSGSNNSGSTGQTPPISGQSGPLTASNGMCVTAGSTITLATCNGSGNQSWGQVATAPGSPSEQFYNAPGNVYLGASSQSTGGSVIGMTSPTNATWTAFDNGDGTNMLSIDRGGSTCLTVSGSSLALADCSVGNANQSFTLQNPYVGSSVLTGSAGSSPSSGSGSTQSSGGTVTGSSSDVTALLNALFKADPSFNCSTLSDSSIVQQCNTLFRE